MNLNIDPQRLFSILRQLAAWVAIGTQVANLGHLGTMRPLLAAAGALILGIEHYVGDPSTGTPSATTTVTTPSATALTTVETVTPAPKVPVPGPVPQT